MKVNYAPSDAQMALAIWLGNHESSRNQLSGLFLERENASIPQLFKRLWTPSHVAASSQHSGIVRKSVRSCQGN